MADVKDYLLPDKAPEPPEATLDAGLPASIDAERTVLGAILLDNAAFNEAAETLEADDFSLDSHQRIYLRMTELADAGKAIDIVTLAEELNRNKQIETVGGVAYLASLTEGLPLRPVIVDYIRIVKDKSRLRRIMAICSAGIARAADQSETALEVLGDVEGRLLEIAQEAVAGKLRTVADSVEEEGGVDEYLRPIITPTEQTGLMTGFTDFDRMTGGLQRSELIVIAARPSQGKTGIMANILEHICIDNDFVGIIFSLEMSRKAIERRLLASIARVDVGRAMRGEFVSALEKEKLHGALTKMVESERLFIDDTSALSPTQIRAKARRLKQRLGRLDIIALDYMQIASAGHRFANRQEEVASISRALKACAKELECPVLALAQLSRSSEQRTDKRPILSDLRESGQIEQDADVVCFLHRDQYYRPDDEEVKGLADLIIAKQRNGNTGIVKLAFVPEIVRFDNLAWGR